MFYALVVLCLASGDGGADSFDAGLEPEDAGLIVDAPLMVVADAGVDLTPPSAEAENLQGKPEFVKGELSVYLGSDRLTVKNTRIGVSAGVDRFLQSYYVLIEPLVDLRFLDGQLGIGVGVPLRLEVVNFETNPMSGAPFLFSRAGRLRVEDYDSFHDFGRILKYVTYGRKEDNLYISAGQRYASSIGHGAITRRYSPNIDVDYPRASAQVDAYNDYGGFELMTNDLLAWNQLAGIAFIKPLSFFKPENLIAKTLSIGVSGGLDWQAPYELVVMSGERQVRDGRLLATQRTAGLVGFDIEAKVVKTENIDIKPYVDYSFLVGGDGGFTAGVLGRFNVGKKIVNAFRIVAEARFLGDRYIPSYFDTFYEVDRFIYRDVRTDPDVANFMPKHRYALEHGLGQRAGYYFEASWGIRNAIGVTLALEGTSNSPAKNFVAHLEVPVLSFVQVFGSYYLRGVETFAELGALDKQGNLGLFGSKAIAFAGARLRVLPFLFINGRLYKTFRVNQELQRYDNQFGFVVDLEIGYEFRKSEPPPPPRDEDRARGQGSALGSSAMR